MTETVRASASERVAEICRLCDEAGIDRPAASEPFHTVLNSAAEMEHLPACGFWPRRGAV